MSARRRTSPRSTSTRRSWPRTESRSGRGLPVGAQCIRAHRARGECAGARAATCDGQRFERELTGLAAVCLQHEMDHLAGKLFVDYLSGPQTRAHPSQTREGAARARRRCGQACRARGRARHMTLCCASSSPARRNSRCRRLQALARSSHRLVGVLTQPDRPAGRGREFKASPVKRLALELALPLAQPAALSSARRRQLLGQWAPEVLVVVAYGLIRSPASAEACRAWVASTCTHRCCRVGAAPPPIQRAILAGDGHTGVTIMQIEAGLDTGPSCAAPLPIAGRHRIRSSCARPAVASRRRSAAGNAAAGRNRPAVPRAAARPRGSPTLPNRQKRGDHLDWWRSAQEIDRQVRAFTPGRWPRRCGRASSCACGRRARSRVPARSGAGGAARRAVLGLAHEQLLVQLRPRGRLGCLNGCSWPAAGSSARANLPAPGHWPGRGSDEQPHQPRAATCWRRLPRAGGGGMLPDARPETALEQACAPRRRIAPRRYAP